MKDSLPAARRARQQKYLDAGPGGAGDKFVFLLGLSSDNLGKIEDGDQAFRLGVLVGHNAVARLPVGGAVVPISPSAVIERLPERLKLRQQFVEEGATIRYDRLLQMRIQLLQLRRVDVDGNLVSFARKVLWRVARDGHVQPRSQH